MAKKKSMNLIEAHLEKVVLLLALTCFLWVFYTRFLRTTGIESAGRVVKPSERAKLAAEQAEGILRSINEKTSGNTQPIDPWNSPVDTFAKLQPLETNPVDSIPLSPPYGDKGEMEEEDRLYEVPDILALSDVKIDLTHTPVVVPVVQDGTPGLPSPGPMAAEGMTAYGREGTKIQDMDFVTVEAKFSLAEMHTLFRQSFAGPTIKKPLESPDPVIAAVELQHSRLLPDGQWSPWEKASRLSVDPMAEKTLVTEDFSLMSRANFDVLLENRKDPVVQLMMLEPQPYTLLSGTWMSPTEKEEYEKEQKEKRRLTTAAPGGGPAGARRGAAAMPVRGREMPLAGERDMPGGDRMMGEGERRTAEVPMGSSRIGGDNARYQNILSQNWSEIQKITLWAHDDQVRPGATYRYRIRLGFFNPIVGHNWFTKEQAALKNQIVLWSPWSSPDKVVSIPERVLFFPVVATRGSEQSYKMDVYREQKGVWYRQRFDVIPGLTVGFPMDVEPDAAKSSMETVPRGTTAAVPEKVDYSTGITVLDVFPRLRYWTLVGRSINEVNTPVILYLDGDGVVQRLPADKLAWPDGWSQKKTRIDRMMSDRKKAARSPAAGPGGAGEGFGERRGNIPAPGGEGPMR